MNVVSASREAVFAHPLPPRRRRPANRPVRDPRWGWLWSGCAVLVVQMASAAALSPRFLVEPDQAVVSGVRGDLGRRVREIAGVPASNLFLLDVPAIERRVRQIAEVDTVKVLRRLPNRIEIAVVPRSPACALRTVAGKWFVADRSFVPFRAVATPPKGLARLLFHRTGGESVVPGLPVAYAEEAEAVRQCWNWCRRHPEFPVGSVTLDRQGRLCLNGTSGVAVHLGGPERLDLKLESFSRLLEERPGLGEDPAVRYVNLYDEGSAAVGVRSTKPPARTRPE